MKKIRGRQILHIIELRTFSTKFPAFFYGLFFYCGCLFSLSSFFSFFSAFFLLFFVEKKHVFYLTLTFLAPLPLISHLYSFPESGKCVEGSFYIDKIQENARFSKGWIYQGILKTPQKERIKCSLITKESLNVWQAYKIKGIIKTEDRLNFSLKITSDLVPLDEKNWSLAFIRLKAKKSVERYIKIHIPQERAAIFLKALIIGEIEDIAFKNEFRKLGLSHIMAISGFHFGLIACAFHLLLRLFFSYKINASILIIILSAYFLFLGNSPSIFRAWVFACMTLVGRILERRTFSLNLLGIASIITLLCEPLSAMTLSFQLSFLATAGILFFYSFCDKNLQIWLPKMPLTEVVERSFLWQGGYIFISLLRQSLALSLAVHLPLLPLLLFYFHSFSLNSLFYNLFFPFFTGISMILFLLGCLLGNGVHFLNALFTENLLKITEAPPLIFKTFYINTFPAWILTFYLTILLIFALKILTNKKEKLIFTDYVL